ncbi:TPA: hypothetical protein RQM97_003704 [Aeromonas dhakensis]|uniref:hypothetical protein n=1 Tax=Aeromonas TaxID=642 RepID=UPI00029B3C1C|nr:MULTISPECIES: hypothetical protein [Aeromonas]MDD9307434.1 hypothetical protein [Aeromonas hydrophila]ELM3752821.1 hypothetical protein [Aeromonas dhakensis]MBF8449555.1 hypothetical protein [Aeromonas dhakensis]MBL0459840.1 hypothetical protein [Aeromonas dhakensis]MBL0524120.1 hypothetical protein [Aeromonas dhakensis]
MKHWLVLGISLLMAGCAQWPSEGKGGMAELRPTWLPLNEDEQRLLSGYDERQQKLDQQLVSLQQAGLRDCMPAGLKQLQSQRVDIVRDVHGRLWADVAWRQAMLAESLKQVRLQLEKTTSGGCSRSWSGLPLRQWRQT